MRKVISLEFPHIILASFTRDEDFDVDKWTAIHSEFLKEIGVKKVHFELIEDECRLSWEEAILERGTTIPNVEKVCSYFESMPTLQEKLDLMEIKINKDIMETCNRWWYVRLTIIGILAFDVAVIFIGLIWWIL